MTKKQLRARMRDMLLGANQGYSSENLEECPMSEIEPQAFFGWVHSVLTEFVPEKHHLWSSPRSLHVFSSLDTAVDAVWAAIPDEE